MRRRWQIAVITILALTVHSAGFCDVTPSGCERAACPTHERGGSRQHSQNSGPQTTHECCHSAMCLNGAELTADKDGKAASPVQGVMPVVATLRLVAPTGSASRFGAFARVHAPPSLVPIFLSIRALLI
jgi:hypothetical protein